MVSFSSLWPSGGAASSGEGSSGGWRTSGSRWAIGVALTPVAVIGASMVSWVVLVVLVVLAPWMC